MSYNKEKEIQDEAPIQKVRVTLTSTKVKEIEKVTADIIKRAAPFTGDKSTDKVVLKGPIRLPTKHLKITTRKTPNGEGSKTWDTYEMRVHKRVIDLYSNISTVHKITNFHLEPGVDVEITMAQ
ncbi:40S ribosomal protein uS10 [Magnusiomyces paraingens]|uniref:Small ribosomal subunit protein uS10 n=1 Tax=Magnusiomyces paraingens TaxID=2606893 RepID=A0A5E8B9V4_9ASCO|nr:uncharacterized protein SAPINGB_P001036 [Saprochaete ingens]VVT46080.1 unnamed protein product [Saprochaete ingens]